jgi:hypothetical protein
VIEASAQKSLYREEAWVDVVVLKGQSRHRHHGDLWRRRVPCVATARYVVDNRHRVGILLDYTLLDDKFKSRLLIPKKPNLHATAGAPGWQC